MTQRDRQILIIGGILSSMLLIYMLILRPLGNAVDDADARIDERRAAVVQMRELSQEAQRLRASMPRGSANVNLLSYMEGLARQADLGSNIDSMKPGMGITSGTTRRNSVEVKLSRVNLKQITHLLYQVEHGGRYPLRVHELHIKKRFDNPELIDVVLEVYQG
jgi:type II secretory pathway component PulM